MLCMDECVVHVKEGAKEREIEREKERRGKRTTTLCRFVIHWRTDICFAQKLIFFGRENCHIICVVTHKHILLILVNFVFSKHIICRTISSCFLLRHVCRIELLFLPLRFIVLIFFLWWEIYTAVSIGSIWLGSSRHFVCMNMWEYEQCLITRFQSMSTIFSKECEWMKELKFLEHNGFILLCQILFFFP